MSDDDPVFAAVHDFYDNCLQDYLHIAAMKNESPIYNPNWEKDGELLECLKYMKDYSNIIVYRATRDIKY